MLGPSIVAFIAVRRMLCYYDCCYYCRLSAVQTSSTVVPVVPNVTCQQGLVPRNHILCHGMWWLWGMWIKCLLMTLCVLMVRNAMMTTPAVSWRQAFMAVVRIQRYYKFCLCCCSLQKHLLIHHFCCVSAIAG